MYCQTKHQAYKTSDGCACVWGALSVANDKGYWSLMKSKTWFGLNF